MREAKMLLPVRCITCGRVLGNLGRKYVEGLQRVGLDRAGEVLDGLGLTRMCCRGVMTTHVDVCERTLDYDRANSVRNRMDTSHERIKITRRGQTAPRPQPVRITNLLESSRDDRQVWTPPQSARVNYGGDAWAERNDNAPVESGWDEWVEESIEQIARPENLMAILAGVYGDHMHGAGVVESSGWDALEDEAIMCEPYDPFNPAY